MLYDISIFWDRRHPARADAYSSESTHWVQVASSDSAKTTIYVASAQDANDLAAMINRLCCTQSETQEAA